MPQKSAAHVTKEGKQFFKQTFMNIVFSETCGNQQQDCQSEYTFNQALRLFNSAPNKKQLRYTIATSLRANAEFQNLTYQQVWKMFNNTIVGYGVDATPPLKDIQKELVQWLQDPRTWLVSNMVRKRELMRDFMIAKFYSGVAPPTHAICDLVLRFLKGQAIQSSKLYQSSVAMHSDAWNAQQMQIQSARTNVQAETAESDVLCDQGGEERAKYIKMQQDVNQSFQSLIQQQDALELSCQADLLEFECLAEDQNLLTDQ